MFVVCAQAALDPRMRALYLNYTNTLTRGGVQLVTQFISVGKYSRYGSWGLKLASDQAPAEAPKYLGFLDFLAQNQYVVLQNCVFCLHNTVNVEVSVAVYCILGCRRVCVRSNAWLAARVSLWLARMPRPARVRCSRRVACRACGSASCFCARFSFLPYGENMWYHCWL